MKGTVRCGMDPVLRTIPCIVYHVSRMYGVSCTMYIRYGAVAGRDPAFVLHHDAVLVLHTTVRTETPSHGKGDEEGTGIERGRRIGKE